MTLTGVFFVFVFKLRHNFMQVIRFFLVTLHKTLELLNPLLRACSPEHLLERKNQRFSAFEL